MLTGVFIDGKTFQNRRVSSPAPVTIVCNCIIQHYINIDVKIKGQFVFVYDIIKENYVIVWTLVPDHQETLQGIVLSCCGRLELQPN